MGLTYVIYLKKSANLSSTLPEAVLQIEFSLQRYGFNANVFLLLVLEPIKLQSFLIKHDNLSRNDSRPFERLKALIVLTLLLKTS